jgi:hypothetical protein
MCPDPSKSVSNRFKYARIPKGYQNMDMKRIKPLSILLICLLTIQPVFADARDNVRKAGAEYAKPLEVIMVDGPMYANGHAYYVADYVNPDSIVAASLVYDTSSRNYVSDEETIRKVLATKDLKKLTTADPLFFALGDPSNLLFASKYETENVRNFAFFSSITPEERNILEIFLQDYEKVMEDVANVSTITQDILYWDNSLEIHYFNSPPSVEMELKEGFSGGRFSYEDFEKLVSSYDSLYNDYLKLSTDLAAFAGGLPEYQPGAIIREKWEVQITKEGILEEIELIEENGAQMRIDIDLRKDILSHPYTPQISEAAKRLGVNPNSSSKGVLSSITNVLIKFKTIIFGIFGIGALILFHRDRKPPEKGLQHILLAGTVLLSLIALPISYGDSLVKIPTMGELISQKVGINETVPYNNLAIGIDDNVVEELILGFRLMFKGETVEVRGPFNYYDKPYYFFDIKRENVSTGHGFLVDAEKYRLVGDQRKAYQLLKTLLFSDLLKDKPLYTGENPDLIEKVAKETLESPLDFFLTNLSVNVREGVALEKELIENPDFKILLNLTEHYVEAFVLIQNINQLIPLKDSEKLTGGLSKKLYLFDAYSRATRGLSSQEYLQGRIAQYRGRTLNRLPLISSLSIMGLKPSKAQVAHDLTSDLIYDNVYIWRKGTITNPAIFARLAFREGTFTVPKSTENLSISSSD